MTYRKIFVTEPGHDMTTLMKYCERIVFILCGKENFKYVNDAAVEVLQDFDPEEDAFCPTGRSPVNFIIGYLLHDMFPCETINIAVYKNQDYHFEELG